MQAWQRSVYYGIAASATTLTSTSSHFSQMPGTLGWDWSWLFCLRTVSFSDDKFHPSTHSFIQRIEFLHLCCGKHCSSYWEYSSEQEKKPRLHGTLIWVGETDCISYICFYLFIASSSDKCRRKMKQRTGQRVTRSSESTALSFPKLDVISSGRHFIFLLGVMAWTTESSRYKNHDFCWIDLHYFFL